MGISKYQTQIMDLFRKSPVVDYGSIARIVKKKQYTKILIRNLLASGKIKKLAKGQYTIHENPQLLVFCFRQAYFGLQDALSFHNLWEQETIPVIITTQKVRAGIRRILGANVLVRRINKKYFFGFDYFKQGDYYFPYSDIEKTFIDLIYFKGRISREVLENMLEKLDRKKLLKYLSSYSKKTKQEVLKFIS